MNINKLNNLTKISREKSLFYETFLKWEEYKFSEDLIGKVWFLDESFISIYGTKEYDNLTDFQKKHLSYLEVCQTFYIYTTAEAIMCLFLARLILKYTIGTPEYNFILREQIEEYRHQDMFERSLNILQSKHSEISNIWKYIMKFEALHIQPKYFFILQIVIEIISGDFGRKCIENKDVFKLIRDISQIHEIEEARHIEFAGFCLDDYFKKSGFFTKTLGGWYVFFDILFINAHYLKIENFKKLGADNYNELYKIAKKNWKENKLKSFSSKRGIEFLERYGLLTWGNRWAFKCFLGFKK